MYLCVKDRECVQVCVYCTLPQIDWVFLGSFWGVCMSFPGSMHGSFQMYIKLFLVFVGIVSSACTALLGFI